MDPATTEIYALALHDALPFFAVPAVSVTVAELTPVSPVAEKLRVRSPAAPVIARFVKVATPVSVVVAVRGAPSVPPPLAIAAGTVTPPWLTPVPAPSPSRTPRCGANAAPHRGGGRGCAGNFR